MENRSSKLSNVTIGMGGALIIIIFVVLCLTVFSVLSFTTAYSDLKLAKKTEEFTYDYYKAHGKAEKKLAEIYEVLLSVNNSIESEISPSEAFYIKVADVLTEIDGVSLIDSNNDSFALYYEAFGDKNQKICVTLNIIYDEESNIPYYDIVTWNLAAIELPLYEEEEYNLWEGFE